MSWFSGNKPPARETIAIAGDGAYGFPVVGESHYQVALNAICGGRTETGHEHYCEAILETEPDNPHDPNAVAVRIDGRKVGHIPRDLAPRIARAIGMHRAAVKAVIVGGWSRRGEIGSYGVRLDL